MTQIYVVELAHSCLYTSKTKQPPTYICIHTHTRIDIILISFYTDFFMRKKLTRTMRNCMKYGCGEEKNKFKT